VIDDEADIGRILQIFLTKKGFDVLTAESGEKGLEVLKKEQPDLLILDMSMPGIGGQGVLKELKKGKPSFPIIILTGSMSEEEILIGSGPIVSDFVFKPVDLNILLEKVNKLLEN